MALSYEYMVVYAHEKGTGRICITRNKKVETYTDVESLDKAINETNGLKVVVTDFKLLQITWFNLSMVSNCKLRFREGRQYATKW